MSLFAELKRRNVFRVAIAYLAAAWLLTEVAGTLFPVFGVPEWGVRFMVILFALGFLPALIFSWVYELTPEGLKRERDVVRDDSITRVTARRLDGITIGMVLVALAVLAVDRLWLDSRHIQSEVVPQATDSEVAAPASGEASTVDDAGPSIAVLPFANRSARAEDVFFVDGIHDDLLTYISQIGSIKTISRTSVMQYRDTTKLRRQAKHGDPDRPGPGPGRRELRAGRHLRSGLRAGLGRAGRHLPAPGQLCRSALGRDAI
jgi:hypothetical protein